MKQPMGWLVGALLGWGVAFAAPAMAGDDAFTQLLDNLAESGTLSADAKARIGKAAEKEKAKHVRLGGRIQLDVATYTGDDNDHGAGTELRRA
ncbi:MAG: hypothetical protein ACE5FD_16690, partial [Anaerolineae bacterium]